MDVGVAQQLLVLGLDDGTVAVWSLADQQLDRTLLGHTGPCDIVKPPKHLR